jgi:hypothetical protein
MESNYARYGLAKNFRRRLVDFTSSWRGEALSSQKGDDKTMDSWQDVLDWGENTGEITYKERLEAQKLPKRLDPGNNDPADHPIDEGHFESVIAPSCNGTFIGAKNPTQARKEANSRLRSVLRKYRAAHREIGAAPVTDALPDWERLEDFVKQNEGFVERGALFTQGRSKNFVGLKARFRTVAPARLDGPAVLAVLAAMPSGRRKSLGKGLGLLNLMRSMAALPEAIRDLLPPSDLPTALGTGKSPSLNRDTVPPSFWASLEAAIRAALEPPEIAIDDALARIEAGEDPVAVREEVNAARSRDVTNTTTAADGYRQAVHWIVRGWRDGGGDLSLLTDVGQIMARPLIDAAIKAHDARATRRRVPASQGYADRSEPPNEPQDARAVRPARRRPTRHPRSRRPEAPEGGLQRQRQGDERGCRAPHQSSASR